MWTLCQSIGRHMLESRGGIAGQEPPANTVNPRGNGKIINIASLVSYQGGLTVPAYTASLVLSSLCMMIGLISFVLASTLFSV